MTCIITSGEFHHGKNFCTHLLKVKSNRAIKLYKLPTKMVSVSLSCKRQR